MLTIVILGMDVNTTIKMQPHQLHITSDEALCFVQRSPAIVIVSMNIGTSIKEQPEMIMLISVSDDHRFVQPDKSLAGANV